MAQRSTRLGAGILGASLLVLGVWAGAAGAGGEDSAAVRGYIVPTPNNPDVNPATTCSGRFLDNDISDNQPQSPAGTAANAVTLAACSYDAVPYGGPSTEDRPVVFTIIRGPGGLLCGGGTEQSATCALPGINYPAGGEYRVLVNNQAGADQPGLTRVEFCADDPPVTGTCGPDDEQSTLYTIDWQAAGGGGGAKCAGKPVTIVASGGTTKGTGGNDVIAGSGGNDTIKGKGGKDRICGKGGKDKLKGGGGKDNLKGGGGADRLNGGGGKDRCKGGPGKDKLKGCEKGSD
ncbi:MAG: hypothetical protein ACRDLO_07180 [Solirubrobacterales bacterium]